MIFVINTRKFYLRWVDLIDRGVEDLTLVLHYNGIGIDGGSSELQVRARLNLGMSANLTKFESVRAQRLIG